MKLLRTLIAALMGLAVITANAQWQWKDKDGRLVFSDRAPPPDIPEKSILKKPLLRERSAPQAASEPAAPGEGASAPAAVAGKDSGTDKSLEAKKKKAEAEEEAKRKAEEERNARMRAENCARARQAKAGLDAGGRMSRINDKGEREFFDDGMRASEGARLQSIIDQDCR